MLRTTKAVSGNRLHAVDGELGRCKDLLFDDRNWVIRYLVADTGTWIPKRKVLISPLSVREFDWQMQSLHVDLTKKQIESSPPLEQDAPVSQRHEQALSSYYHHPFYWSGGDLWGPTLTPALLRQRGVVDVAAESSWVPAGDDHLRSLKEVTGYTTHAQDGDLGDVEELIMDDQQWIIRYLVLNTRRWLPGRSVLVPTECIDRFDWSERTAYLDTTKEQVKEFPAYEPNELVNHRYEERLYDFHGRPALP